MSETGFTVILTSRIEDWCWKFKNSSIINESTEHNIKRLCDCYSIPLWLKNTIYSCHRLLSFKCDVSLNQQTFQSYCTFKSYAISTSFSSIIYCVPPGDGYNLYCLNKISNTISCEKFVDLNSCTNNPSIRKITTFSIKFKFCFQIIGFEC